MKPAKFLKAPFLQPCPFCGRRVHQTCNFAGTVYSISCSGRYLFDTGKGCGAEGPRRRSAKGAAAAWNAWVPHL